VADEFDDLLETAGRHPSAPLARPVTARLVSRLYRAADPRLRPHLLERLLKPLGTLGLMAVAAGAFGRYVQRGGALGAMDDLQRFSNEQMIELARFVEQVSPEALKQFAVLLAENPVGMAAFSVAAAALLMRKLQDRERAPRRAG